MPPRRVYQESLPGVAEAIPLRWNPEALNAFCRAATPEYFRLKYEDYADITPELMEKASADHLRPSLIDVPQNSPSAVWFKPGDRHGESVLVAVTPEEYGLIGRNIDKLGQAAVNKTLASRPRDIRFEPHRSAAERSGVHTVENKQRGMKQYLDGTIVPQVELLEWFSEAAQHHWRARGKEADMRMKLGVVSNQIFENMFLALREQRQWKPEQEMLARRTVEKRLFFEREHNQHIQNWLEMFELNHEYLGYKRALFLDRIYHAQRYIDRHAEPSKHTS